MFTIVILFCSRRFTYHFRKVLVLLGRAPDNDVVLIDDLASRHHCRMIVDRGRCYFEDLGSKNGFYLEDRRIAGRVRIEPYEKVRIGETLLWIEFGRVALEELSLASGATQPDDSDPTPAPIFPRGPRTRSQPKLLRSVPSCSKAPGAFRPERAPTRSSLRRLMDAVLPASAKFHAFCIDYYSKIASAFTPNMDRMSQESLLLEGVAPEEILRCLRQACPEEIARYSYLLEYAEER